MKSKNDILADVTQEGAVLLSPNVVCDGLYYGPKVRVQSHIHVDHMNEFETSKGFQEILLSNETYDLIVLEKDAEIPYRVNVVHLENEHPFKIDDEEIIFLSSGHMLGAVQTQVNLSSGKRVGYSGDFQWPLEKVIQVDTLVVDSTYGSPHKIKQYTQNEVKSRLIDLVLAQLRTKPVLLHAHRGTLQHAIDILSREINIPFVCDQSMYEEIEIYQKYGYDISQICSIETNQGKDITKNNRYVYICDTRKRNPAENLCDMVTINLSGYMGDPRDPILKFSNNAYRVALSGHADFQGTLAYVKATGAKEVITDNTRGGHAYELAMAIQNRLAIEARPSSNSISNNWRY